MKIHWHGITSTSFVFTLHWQKEKTKVRIVSTEQGTRLCICKHMIFSIHGQLAFSIFGQHPMNTLCIYHSVWHWGQCIFQFKRFFHARQRGISKRVSGERDITCPSCDNIVGWVWVDERAVWPTAAMEDIDSTSCWAPCSQIVPTHSWGPSHLRFWEWYQRGTNWSISWGTREANNAPTVNIWVFLEEDDGVVRGSTT